MKERVLITGASGFLGYHLITSALEMGLDVYAAVRSRSNIAHLQDLPVKYSYLNYEDPGSLAKELSEKQFNYIIHAAGITKALKQQEYDHINAAYTVNLAKAIDLQAGYFKKMVFISSLAAVGPLKGADGIITEQTNPNPVTAYGRSKLLAEKKLAELAVPSVVLRPTAIYGPRDKEIFVIVQTLSKGFDPYIGRSRQQLTFVYAKDVADIAVKALFTKEAKGVYNIGDGKIYSKYAFADITKKLLNKKALRMHLPTSVVRLFAFSLETVNGWLKKPTMVSREKLNELMAENWNCDISKAKTELNFDPQYDLEKGLTDSIQWYQKNKWI